MNILIFYIIFWLLQLFLVFLYLSNKLATYIIKLKCNVKHKSSHFIQRSRMQKGEKYIYNQQTLQFEKVKISNKNLFFKVFMYISSVAVTALIFYFLTSEYFPSPKEKLLQKEMAQLEYNYQLMESHLERANKIVQNLQTRDAKVHYLVWIQ